MARHKTKKSNHFRVLDTKLDTIKITHSYIFLNLRMKREDYNKKSAKIANLCKILQNTHSFETLKTMKIDYCTA